MLKKAETPVFFAKYRNIIAAEQKLTGKNWRIFEPEDIFNITYQIREFAKASTVLRSYTSRYGLSEDSLAFESVGAHTNLMAALVDRALEYLFPSLIDCSIDGYNYREIIEAVRRHDLPENITGDIPDNGERDEGLKSVFEHSYHKHFGHYIVNPYSSEFNKKVNELLLQMEKKDTTLGRLLYSADKTAAIIIVLYYDSINKSPRLNLDNQLATSRDLAEMKLCDYRIRNSCRASEMWTIDFLKARELNKYDDYGFFTAIIVMYTLVVKGEWYNWRKNEYT